MIKHYYPITDAIIYVVDSTETDRFDELSEDIAEDLKEDSLKGCPFIILANKQDLSNALSIDEISKKLKLDIIDREYKIFGVSVYTHEGLKEAFDWISSKFKENESDTLLVKLKSIFCNIF